MWTDEFAAAAGCVGATGPFKTQICGRIAESDPLVDVTAQLWFSNDRSTLKGVVLSANVGCAAPVQSRYRCSHQPY